MALLKSKEFTYKPYTMSKEYKEGYIVAINFNCGWRFIPDIEVILTPYGETIVIAIWRIKKLK